VKEQIFRRIPRQRQLGKQHQIRPGIRTSLPRGIDDPRRVPVHITNEQIDLRECNPE
jgi:hypothetical protein